jgi:hypothetical protein
MSTVSLMPVGKKIRVKREIRIPILNILSSGMHLQQMGLIIGKTLILDANSVFRIEAFSAAVKDKSFSSTKITVFPENSKSGSLYIELDGLDGLSWESVDESQKTVPKPVRRVDVKIDREIDVTYCWSQAFNGRYNIVPGEEFPEVVINPLVLDKLQLADGRFLESSTYKIGDATVKIDKEVFVYEIQALDNHYFEIGNIQSHGFSLLSAKLSEISVNLQIRKSFGAWEHLATLNPDDVSKDTITKIVTNHLITLHEL